MPKSQKKETEKAGSKKAVRAKENKPFNDAIEPESGEQKIIGIGMPVTAKRMEQLKKKAKKPDK